MASNDHCKVKRHRDQHVEAVSWSTDETAASEGGQLDVTKPSKFTRFGDIDVTKPHKFMRFGAMEVTRAASPAASRVEPSS